MKIKKLALTDSERSELTLGFYNGLTHCFRMRCRCVLFKSKGLSSLQVGSQTEMIAQSVNGWVKRLETYGIQDLNNRPGQGRKPIMDYSNGETVRKAIESDRQSVKMAKETWQNSFGKDKDLSFRRFLSALAQDIDV